MKGISLTLLGVLAVLHWLEGNRATALPLSMFRDGNHAWLGYVAFALLILIGLAIARRAYVSGDLLACLVYVVAIALLSAIAATPSFDSFHIFISLLLPFILYVYYLTLLYSGASRWMFLHLCIPVILLFAIRFHSFGAWQKSMILYFGLVANVHYGLLPGPARKMAQRRPSSETQWDRDERRLAEGWIGKSRTQRSVD